MSSLARRLRSAVLLLTPLLAAGPAGAEHAEPAVPLPAAPAPAAASITTVARSPMEQEAQGLLALGAKLTERADYAAAEIAYRQILDHRGFTADDQTKALLGLARMYRRQGTYIKATAIYERFLKDQPEHELTPDVMLDLGRTLRAMGAHKLAISRFYSVINSTLKLNSEGFAHYQQLARTAQFEIAETHYEAGNFAEAGKFFLRLKLLDLAPADRARAHFKAACAQQLDGDAETAVTTLRSFLEQWPEDENTPEARYLLATLLRQLNRPQEALATTLALLQAEQARTGSDARRWAYWQRRTGNQLANEFFQTGDTLSALTIYQGLAVLAPEPAWRLPVVYQIALCHERLHQASDAREAYRSICEAVRPAEGAPPAGPQLTELARMAEWRLTQLDWREQTDRRLNHYFDTTTGRVTTPPPPTAHDADGSAPAASAAL
ncbi:MAG: tetratricopeptide repeat protein [Opitutaceae bacterium]|nr:tetratricopeptide repeat protein [Opitutaceae bacterium]